MYLLRRGPLLAPILQHEDDIDYMRCLFLNSDFEDSLRLIDPPLFEAVARPTDALASDPIEESALNSVRLERLPLEDLALQSSKVLLLDHHTDIFIWIGLGAKHRTHLIRACKRYAKKLASSRFPSPTIMTFSVRPFSQVLRYWNGVLISYIRREPVWLVVCNAGSFRVIKTQENNKRSLFLAFLQCLLKSIAF